jgi:hypothetical protein
MPLSCVEAYFDRSLPDLNRNLSWQNVAQSRLHCCDDSAKFQHVSAVDEKSSAFWGAAIMAVSRPLQQKNVVVARRLQVLAAPVTFWSI